MGFRSLDLAPPHAISFFPFGELGKLRLAKEALIVSGLRIVASLRELSQITGLSSPAASRRDYRAIKRRQLDNHLQNPTARGLNVYNNGEPK